MEEFDVLLTPTEWVKVHALQKLITTVCRPAYFVEPTQLLPHPGHWVLAGLQVTSFKVMTTDNDYNLIPSASMLANFNQGWNLPQALVWTPTRCAVVSTATHWATELHIIFLSPAGELIVIVFFIRNFKTFIEKKSYCLRECGHRDLLLHHLHPGRPPGYWAWQPSHQAGTY